MKPCECQRGRDVCGLEFSHKSVRDFDIMIQHDGAVILTKHQRGQPTEAQIIIPRQVFQIFVAWWEKDQA